MKYGPFSISNISYSLFLWLFRHLSPSEIGLKTRITGISTNIWSRRNPFLLRWLHYPGFYIVRPNTRASKSLILAGWLKNKYHDSDEINPNRLSVCYFPSTQHLWTPSYLWDNHVCSVWIMIICSRLFLIISWNRIIKKRAAPQSTFMLKQGSKTQPRLQTNLYETLVSLQTL